MEPHVIHIRCPEIEAIDEIGVGRAEMVLRFNEGMYKGRFLYVKTDIEGERIGSGNPEEFNTTTYIENAGLSEIHCMILFNEELSEYILVNATTQNSGTWVKITPNQFSCKKVLPNSFFKIADLDFFISSGPSYSLEQVAKILVSEKFHRFFTNTKEFISLNTDELELNSHDKYELKEEIGRLKSLPENLRSLVFSAQDINFEVHYKPIRIGNTGNCDVTIPYSSDYFITLQYIHPNYYLEPSDNCPVYQKLKHEEEFVLCPGNIFKVGKIEFLASRFNVGRWSHIGKRQAMEDADVICHNLFTYEDLPIGFYSVYDGHGGSQCSQFLKKTLHSTLRRLILSSPSRCSDVMNTLRSSILLAFAEVDAKFEEENPDICTSVGSAAIVCLILGDRIITANLGDSRAVLCRNGQAIELSIDHKPDNSKELNRILSHGGSVMLGRIDSKLAVSRAFGDFQFKNGSRGSLVSIEPDITQIFINPVEDEFLVIGCDGLFEAYSSQDLVEIIRERLASMPETEQDPNRVIRELVNEAVFENRTSDNVTALLITLSSAISL
ncbi:hypothetical protein SteCoe_34706 [Stentor coeruleus]|uniref:protein-serine/threonine phosphatase n=1 Tax=Stentor coeruleus TaxID=5963 RepID=A0A1R2ATY5_9CILI|nr:hypothetical protein SteCoe_34706 [Stentor coeruleus]